MNRLGVFGGSFDPVHIGHLRMALETQQAMQLDGIHWLPSARPPHRKLAVAVDQHRLAMLELAISGESGWQLDRRELDRPGPSYTIDTLTDFKAQYPQSSLYLLLGGDAFAAFDRWHRWRDILDLAHLVVMERPGQDLARDLNDERSASVADELKSRFASADTLNTDLSLSAGRIVRLPLTPLAIASSNIRALCLERKSARFLVPDLVYEYIDGHDLYASN